MLLLHFNRHALSVWKGPNGCLTGVCSESWEIVGTAVASQGCTAWNQIHRRQRHQAVECSYNASEVVQLIVHVAGLASITSNHDQKLLSQTNLLA